MSDEPSRRRILGVIAAGSLGIASAAAHAQDAPVAQKQSKAEAQYQDRPNNGQLCGICAFFVPPSSCQRVEGEVHPTGWCKNFQLKR